MVVGFCVENEQIQLLSTAPTSQLKMRGRFQGQPNKLSLWGLQLEPLLDRCLGTRQHLCRLSYIRYFRYLPYLSSYNT